MSVHLKPEHLRLAQKLVDETHARGGLAPVDLDRFWEDNKVAHQDPWAADAPQTPIATWMSNECVFAELDQPGDWYRLTHDADYRIRLEHAYNDRAEQIVGRRLLGERRGNPARAMPPVRGLHDLFEGRNVWHNESYWLMPAASNEDELRALLDRVEKRLEDPRGFFLPSGWDEGKERALAAGGRVPLYRAQRGPVTFAMSLFGVEKLIFLLLDEPELGGRFRDLILRGMLARARVLDEEAGHTPETAPRGFYWLDDNCAMLTPELYEFFGYPILKGMFDRYAPDPDDHRGQHSDSDMGHLLPLLGKLDLRAVNFGPNLTVTEIREHLPHAVISGQLAPFTFSRNEEVNMVAEFLRDREMAREHRGLVFATAGSINNGSRLTGLRLLMAAAQRFRD